MKVFIGGSISIKELPTEAIDHIERIVAAGHDVVIGDAAGVDALVQQRLHELGHLKVTVFTRGPAVRVNVGEWATDVVADREGFQPHGAKDFAMTDAAEIGFVVWDGRSKGTLTNIEQLVYSDKDCVIQLEPTGQTVKITDPIGLDHVLSFRPFRRKT